MPTDPIPALPVPELDVEAIKQALNTVARGYQYRRYVRGGAFRTAKDDLSAALAEVERLTKERDDAVKDALFHYDCRPNRRQAEAWRDDAKATNDRWADEVKARREAEAEIDRLRALVPLPATEKLTCSKQTVHPRGFVVGCEHLEGHEGDHAALIDDIAEYQWAQRTRVPLPATPTEERRRALAVEAASTNHCAIYRGARNPNDLVSGHSRYFDTCPHPDCVLVRKHVAFLPVQDEAPKVALRRELLAHGWRDVGGGCLNHALFPKTNLNEVGAVALLLTHFTPNESEREILAGLGASRPSPATPMDDEMREAYRLDAEQNTSANVLALMRKRDLGPSPADGRCIVCNEPYPCSAVRAALAGPSPADRQEEK